MLKGSRALMELSRRFCFPNRLLGIKMPVLEANISEDMAVRSGYIR